MNANFKDRSLFVSFKITSCHTKDKRIKIRFIKYIIKLKKAINFKTTKLSYTHIEFIRYKKPPLSDLKLPKTNPLWYKCCFSQEPQTAYAYLMLTLPLFKSYPVFFVISVEKLYHLLSCHLWKQNAKTLTLKYCSRKKKTSKKKQSDSLPPSVILYVTSPWGPASRSVALTLKISVPTSLFSGIWICKIKWYFI